MYGVVPPVTVTVAVPVQAGQPVVSSVLEVFKSKVLSTTATLSVSPQNAASTIVTKYVPAHKPVAVGVVWFPVAASH